MLFILCIFSVICQALAGVAPTHLLVTRVGPCYETTNTKVMISEMTLTKKEYDSALTGTLNITEDIDDGWFIKAKMQKCHDIRNLDTCDYFRSFNVIQRGCTGDEADDEDLYTMFFHYAQPKLECPLKAGSYRISNYPFFTEDSDLTAAESKISTSVFGYTYRLEGFGTDEDDRIMCVDAYIQLQYVREHNWLAGTNISTTTKGPTDYEDVEQEGAGDEGAVGMNGDTDNNAADDVGSNEPQTDNDNNNEEEGKPINEGGEENPADAKDDTDNVNDDEARQDDEAVTDTTDIDNDNEDKGKPINEGGNDNPDVTKDDTDNGNNDEVSPNDEAVTDKIDNDNNNEDEGKAINKGEEENPNDANDDTGNGNNDEENDEKDTGDGKDE